MLASPKVNMSEFDDLFAGLGLGNTSNAIPAPIMPKKGVIMKEEPKPIPAPVVEATPVEKTIVQRAQEKMQQINAELNLSFVEREDLIKLMQLALCTGSNLLMIGPPGSGKTMLAQEMCSHIDQANYFQWMLNKTSDPSEILGSFSIKQMENDRFVRVTDGKLPEAHLAFLDELFKCNSPVLNTLLTIMNEHIFYNDGKPNPVPLLSLFGASNEMPEDESLDALYDRFLLRVNVQSVKDSANRKKMFINYLNSHAGIGTGFPKTKITLDEIKALQKEAVNVKVSKDLINKFVRLINDLERQAIHVSDRRQNECFKILQGAALLDNRNEVILDDFHILVYALWSTEEQIPAIEAAITKIVNPYNDRFKEVKDAFEQIRTDVDSATEPQEKTKRSIEAKGAISKLITKLNKIINDASKNGRETDDYATYRDDMDAYNKKIIAEALGTTFPDMQSVNDSADYQGEEVPF